MAIFDAMFELYDDAQLIGTDATDYQGTTAREIDWVNSGLEMGTGEPVYLNIQVGTTLYSGGTSVDFQLFADDTTSGHDASSDVVLATGPRLIADLTAGAWVFRGALPANVDVKQYLQLGATFVGTVAGGTINAWLDHGPQSSFDTQVTTSNIT